MFPLAGRLLWFLKWFFLTVSDIHNFWSFFYKTRIDRQLDRHLIDLRRNSQDATVKRSTVWNLWSRILHAEC